MDDLISVIVPIYKVEKYLSKCIDSILAQTYTNLEVILVDDGSPDNCGSIADSYAEKDSRVSVIHKTNGGLSSARNAGIDTAKGGYIGFVDSDDYIHPEMYEKLYSAIKGLDADMAVCSYTWVNEDGTISEESLHSGMISAGVISCEQALEALNDCCGIAYTTAFNKLYKSRLLNSCRFPEGKIHEDEFTTHHFFALCSKIVCIPDNLYYYVRREGSITACFEMKNFDAFDAFIDRYHFYKKNGYKDFAGKVLRRSAYNLFLTLSKVHNVKMLARWFGLMVQYLCIMLANPKGCFMLNRKLIHKAVLYTKRYFVWRSVKSDFDSTKDFEKRIIHVATPEHGNLGDQAIVCAEHRIFECCGFAEKIIEIPNSVYLKYSGLIKHFVRPQDLIVIDGGGNLGTLWENEDDKIADIIYRFKENKIFVFPQTCYYGKDSSARLKRNSEIYAGASGLTLTFRDKASYDFAKINFPTVNCKYVPDIVLSIKNAVGQKMRKGVLLCFRKDLEKVIEGQSIDAIKKYLRNKGMPYTETDTVICQTVSAKERKMALHDKWTEFGSAGLVITDRLHGMVFAAITGTPCIAVDNVSKKVSGVYAWINELPYIRVLENPADILENIQEMYSETGFDYNFNYPHFFEEEIKLW